jgi:5-(carboxyamino)imidazole ribonucleotide synthase
MRLGILGGGQLARMLALAAHPLGVRCVVVEPGADPPAAAVAEVVRADFDDPAALAHLAATCDAVTVELEAVPVAALARLAERVPVRPGVAAVAATQDRLREKELCRRLGLRTAPYDDEVGPGPALVKTRRGGFDGRGQRRVASAAERDAACAELPDPIVEGIVPLRRELAVVAARGLDGEIRTWPVVAIEHEDGILRRATAPAPGLDDATAEQARAVAVVLAEALDYVGVMAVELFLCDDGLVVNEIAPRVHNSGHWTIEGSTTSQFEQHVRAVLGFPLGDVSCRPASVMLNAVGGPVGAEALAVPGAHVHHYGKSPRPARKLGHVTVTGDDPAEVAARAARVAPSVPFTVSGVG